jgi:hypothetical protein
MSKRSKDKWLRKPEKHDYPAAESYLTLLYDEETAACYAKALADAPMTSFKAKDIFRASELPLLGATNSHVRQNQKKIAAGKKLSPLLLVRDPDHGKLIIADGYHRMCAVYSFDEDTSVPCKLVGQSCHDRLPNGHGSQSCRC